MGMFSEPTKDVHTSPTLYLWKRLLVLQPRLAPLANETSKVMQWMCKPSHNETRMFPCLRRVYYVLDHHSPVPLMHVPGTLTTRGKSVDLVCARG